MEARLHNSEKEPLLNAHSRHPYTGTVASPSHIRSEKQSLASSFPDNISSKAPPKVTDSHYFSSSSLRVQLLIGIMVAIPTYMLASTAVTSLGPLWPRNSVIRSPQPDPVPQTSSTVFSFPDSNPFASIAGPHISSNFPDPAVISVDGISYAFATNNRQRAPNRINVQVATSTDNQTWTLLDGHDALPTVGTWETGAGVWAPDVVQLVSNISHNTIKHRN